VGLFRKEIPVNVVVDSVEFQQVESSIRQLLDEIARATERADQVTTEMNKATKEATRAIQDLQRAKRQPVIKK
jgi:methyl-accepting chemotaxis protein